MSSRAYGLSGGVAGNLGPLSEKFRVFAPTVIGFGRSEKPLVDYSQDLWTEFLRDFTLEVVRTPAVVVGNSIGGFFAASLAGGYPDLVTGCVLLNR
jgi:pimeloyl-ACP methyl ester carboxylesterase